MESDEHYRSPSQPSQAQKSPKDINPVATPEHYRPSSKASSFDSFENRQHNALESGSVDASFIGEHVANMTSKWLIYVIRRPL